jgi:hypothetical protein
MKILKKEDFLKIKGSFLYSSSCNYDFENLNIKLKNIKKDKESIDWFYNPFINCWPKNEKVYNIKRLFDFLDECLKNKNSFELDLNTVERDGFFDEDFFLVYEKKDIEKLIKKLTKVLKDYK